jgi:hypothetical protein
LLAEALKCPVPPEERNDDQGRKQRVISEFSFNGDSQRLSGYRIDTVRAYNPNSNSIDVNLVRIDLIVAFSSITQAQRLDNTVALACDSACFHVTETRGGRSQAQDLDLLFQPLCDAATADNAVAAITALVRVNGGRLSSKPLLNVTK